MATRTILSLIAALVALLAIVFSRSAPAVEKKDFVQGRNNTILFLSNDDFGLANVLVATTYSLLTEHKDLEIHYGTHSTFQKPLDNINRFAKPHALSKPVQAHIFHGMNFERSVRKKMGVDTVFHKTGWWGLAGFLRIMKLAVQPIDAEDYLNTFRQCVALIEEVDPAVVVVENLFAPGVDAIRMLKRREVMLSPSALQDVIGQFQPRGEVLWKYPAMASGYNYPVPWYLVPANIWITLRLGLQIVMDPRIRSINKILNANGIPDPYSPLKTYTKEQTLISIGALDTEYPLTTIPENVLPCGPIYLSSAPVSQQDPALARWLKQAPTILIMLGSHTEYTEVQTSAMIQALRKVFDTTSYQVLWKFMKRTEYSDSVFDSVKDEIKGGRLRLEKWISAEPAALLATGDVILSVNHGGSNCYHEALANGVPQMVLPMWADCFDFAKRAEYRKIGVYGNAKAHPDMDGDELETAFSRVLGDNEEAKAIRESARKLGEEKRSSPGRSCAAREVAKLARMGSA